MIIRPTASRLICNSRNSVRSEQLLETFLARLNASSKTLTTVTTQRIANQGKIGSYRGSERRIGSQNGGQLRYKSGKAAAANQPESPLPPLSDNVPTKFEELPEDYDDAVGLPYTNVKPSQEVTSNLLGKKAKPDDMHRAFAILHGRRVAGTLEDPSLPLPLPNMTTSQYTKVLNYLRAAIRVDETTNAGLRAELELAKIEEEAIKRGESIGLYKPEPEKFTPQSGPKLPPVLQRIREAKKAEWDAKAAALEAKKQAEMEAYKNTPAGQLAVFDERGVEMRRPGENKKLKEYQEALYKDEPTTPPPMSAFSRLWPSALVTLFVVGGSVTFASVYTPPKTSSRLMPDVPFAAATLLPIIGINALVFCLWRFPPAWKMLNKHFLLLPGLPKAWGVLGNAFSHQSFYHLAINMAVLYYMGTRLCDEIGRANFLALYLSCATLGSMSTLTLNVLMKNFHVSSLGASTAVYGVVAAYVWKNLDEGFRFLGIIPPETWPAIPGPAILGVLVVSDLWALRRGIPKTAMKHDHLGHLAGTAVGLAGMEVWKRRNAQRKAMKQKKDSWNKLW